MGLSKSWWLAFLLCFSVSLAGCGEEEGAVTRFTELQPFYGTYTGSGRKVHGSNEESDRDLTVTIKPWEDKGFTVDWSTVIHRGGKEKQTNMSINFYPSVRSGIYASAMQGNVFGKTVPNDPAVNSEQPYVWAGLEANVLTIHALYITPEGGYEMQIYRRALQEQGMALEFERMRDGELVSRIEAELNLVEN